MKTILFVAFLALCPALAEAFHRPGPLVPPGDVVAAVDLDDAAQASRAKWLCLR